MILKIPQFIFLLPDIQDFDLENLDSIPITDLIFHQIGRFEKYLWSSLLENCGLYDTCMIAYWQRFHQRKKLQS